MGRFDDCTYLDQARKVLETVCKLLGRGDKTIDEEDWNFCQNPADLSTRGLTGAALVTNRLWLNGPSFLLQIEWPKSPESPTVDDRASEELAKNPPRVIHSLMNNENQDNQVAIGKVMDIHHYSSLI